MKSRIFAIVATYNVSQDIRSCLDSLVSSNDVSVIVIDNASTDDTIDIISAAYPQIQLISLKANLGFGPANNLGIKEAIRQDAEYVFLLNQDARVDDESIKALLDTISDLPDCGILSPVHVRGDGKMLDRNFRLTLSSAEGLLDDLVLGKKCAKAYRVWFVNAAAWFIPVSAIRKAKGFDPIFFHYGEDDDLANRIRDIGLSMYVCTRSFIWHDRTQKVHHTENAVQTEVYFRNMLISFNDPATNQSLCILAVKEALRLAFRVIFGGRCGVLKYDCSRRRAIRLAFRAFTAMRTIKRRARLRDNGFLDFEYDDYGRHYRFRG